MKSNFRRWLLIAVVALAAIATAVFLTLQNRTVRPVSITEEETAAKVLLLEKLSGPQYFNVPSPASHDEGGPWIEVDAAWSQVPRIVAERKLGPEATRNIERLITQLSEPHPYRVVGGDRVNLLRLNLSLDAIK